MNIQLKVDKDRDNIYYLNGHEVDNFPIQTRQEMEILIHSLLDNIPIECRYSETNILWIELINKEKEKLYLCGAEIGKCLTDTINEIIKEQGNENI